jgi:hypothetical protein
VRSSGSLFGLGAVSAAIYLGLSFAGDLREHIGLLLAAHAVLAGLMLLAFVLVRRHPALLRAAIVAGLLFRLLSVLGPPRLSDDVYRYVWDGRVQAHGIQPYRHAPDAPALAELRDDAWSKINHPQLSTIYPPLAEMAFALLARLGAGPSGFRFAMGLFDFGVVLALVWLLRRVGGAPENVLLYAWNPLAVLETAGSGHIEPLGLLFLVLWAICLARRRWVGATLALAAAIDVKLVAALLVPGYLRRAGAIAGIALLLAVALPFVPYAIAGGPLTGTGLAAYAGSWEHNASFYAGIEAATRWLDSVVPLNELVASLHHALGARWFPWDLLARHAFPRDLARALAGLILFVFAWTAGRGLGLAPQREALRTIGAALLLSPTVHPWYLLWLLPFAAASRTWSWLVWSALAPLAYWSGAAGDVPWAVRAVEYVPLLILLAWERSRRDYLVRFDA